MSTEQRSAPRVELFAQVQVSNESDIYIMSTSNISLGGVFIQGDPQEYPEIQADMVLDLVIFPTEELDATDVHLSAKVVRISADEDAGFGLQFASISEEQTTALERLLQAAG